MTTAADKCSCIISNQFISISSTRTFARVRLYGYHFSSYSSIDLSKLSYFNTSRCCYSQYCCAVTLFAFCFLVCCYCCCCRRRRCWCPCCYCCRCRRRYWCCCTQLHRFIQYFGRLIYRIFLILFFYGDILPVDESLFVTLFSTWYSAAAAGGACCSGNSLLVQAAGLIPASLVLPRMGPLLLSLAILG